MRTRSISVLFVFLILFGGFASVLPIPMVTPSSVEAAVKWRKYNRYWKYYVHSGATVWAYDDGRVYGVGSVKRGGKTTHFWGFDRKTRKNVVRDPGQWGFPGKVRGY